MLGIDMGYPKDVVSTDFCKQVSASSINYGLKRLEIVNLEKLIAFSF